MKVYAGVAIACSALLAAVPANALVITKINITGASNTSDPNLVNNAYLQVAEVEAFHGTTDVAASAAGALASATSIYGGPTGPAIPANANDSSTNGDYPYIYHGAQPDGSDILTILLAGASDITSLSVFGRTDGCCAARDTYAYHLFDGDSEVANGILNATGDNHMATATFAAAVPEPATWGMMLLGFAAMGFGLRSRRRQFTKVSYA